MSHCTSFVAACLILGGAHLDRRATTTKFIHRVMTEKRTNLLSSLTRTPVTPALVRLLQKVDVVVLSRDDLLCALESPMAQEIARLAAHAPRVSFDAIVYLPRVPAWMRTPNLISLLNRRTWDAMEDLLQWKELEAPRPRIKRRILGSLQTVTSRDALLARMEAWEAWMWESQPFPPPPIHGGGNLVPLPSVAALRREARQMQNCLADMIEDVIIGQTYYFSWYGQERATVALWCDEDNEWTLGEYAGYKNCKLSRQTELAIRYVVREQLSHVEDFPDETCEGDVWPKSG